MAGTRRKPGELGPYVDGYRSKLLALGYTPETVRGLLKVLGQLGRWMLVMGLAPTELSLARIDEFLVARRADEARQAPQRRGLVLLLEHLASENVVMVSDPPPRSVLEELLAAYRAWLIDDRGLAASTVLRYENTARRFLRQRSRTDDGGDVASLTGAEVSAFLLAECARCSVGAAQGRVAELRALLRYLYLHGLTPLALSTAVPRSRAGTTPAYRRRYRPSLSRRCWTAVTGPPRTGCATSP